MTTPGLEQRVFTVSNIAMMLSWYNFESKGLGRTQMNQIYSLYLYCCCRISAVFTPVIVNSHAVAHVRITTTIVKTVSGIYTPLLQFRMTQHWLFVWPSHSLFVRTQPATASFLVMAILIQRTRSQVHCSFNYRQQLFSSFRRHGVIRRTMASDPTATEITRFDFLVIGGGSGGLAGARRASELGASSAVIESHKLGGTCVSKNSTNTVIFSDCTIASAAFKHGPITSFTAKPPDCFY